MIGMIGIHDRFPLSVQLWSSQVRSGQANNKEMWHDCLCPLQIVEISSSSVHWVEYMSISLLHPRMKEVEVEFGGY